MENKESKQLQEFLAKVALSLIYKLQQIELALPVSSSIITNEEFSDRGINATKIILGGVVTASLGYAIAYYTNTNENEIENAKLYTGIGALVGIISSYLVQKKKQSLKTDSGQTSLDYKEYIKEVLKDIRKTNEQIRQDWEMAMKQLTESQRKHIKEMPWTDEQKELAISNALVYKSVIITDYHYTDAIEDLEPDENFNENINLLYKKWKGGIVDIINDTKNEQWNNYFSKIYV
jgi:hypothetical protein